MTVLQVALHHFLVLEHLAASLAVRAAQVVQHLTIMCHYSPAGPVLVFAQDLLDSEQHHQLMLILLAGLVVILRRLHKIQIMLAAARQGQRQLDVLPDLFYGLDQINLA